MQIGGYEVVNNAPFTTGLVLLCVLVQLASVFTGERVRQNYFTMYKTSILDIRTYVRWVGHTYGHGDWGHLLGNMSILIITAPMLEMYYGVDHLIRLVLLVTFVTGGYHLVFGRKDTGVCGASGVVFAFMVLSGITATPENTIPVTLIIVMVLHVGKELLSVGKGDGVSHIGHILGGLVAMWYGLMYI